MYCVLSLPFIVSTFTQIFARPDEEFQYSISCGSCLPFDFVNLRSEPSEAADEKSKLELFRRTRTGNSATVPATSAPEGLVLRISFLEFVQETKGSSMSSPAIAVISSITSALNRVSSDVITKT